MDVNFTSSSKMDMATTTAAAAAEGMTMILDNIKPMIPSKPTRMVLYFVALFICAFIVIKQLVAAFPKRKLLYIYTLLAPFAFAVTWINIYWFVQEDMSNFKDIYAWIDGSEVFVKAYQNVSDSALKFWWSQQLLVLVCTLCAFFYIEATRFGIRNLWAYVVLCFGGAVSLGLPLFLFNLQAKSRLQRNYVRSSFFPFSCAICGCVSIFYFRAFDLDSKNYKLNVFFLHGILFIPALLVSSTPTAVSQKSSSSNWCAIFYGMLAGASLMTHISFCVSAVIEAIEGGQMTIVDILKVFLLAGFDGFCQTAVTFDILLSMIECFIFMLSSGYRSIMPVLLVVISPIVSMGVSLPLFLAWRETQVITSNRKRD